MDDFNEKTVDAYFLAKQSGFDGLAAALRELAPQDVDEAESAARDSSLVNHVPAKVVPLQPGGKHGFFFRT